jgi:O-antigen ligase
MARSRAGLILTIVALAGAFALTVPGQRGTTDGVTDGITPRRLLFSATALAVVFAIQFALYRILERFDVDPMDDARIPFARNTLEAAKAYMPFGSGMGSFVPVYAMFEKPQDILPNIYANHAHNDVLELWLETGLAGIVLFGAFAFWFALRTMQVWRRVGEKNYELDNSLARAATIVIVLLLAHSFVDYPLRTDAMMTVFAFSCALLVEPLVGLKGATPARIRAVRREAAPRAKLGVPASAATMTSREMKPASPPANSLPQHLQGRWGEDVIWPKEWSKSMKQDPAPIEDEPPNTDPRLDNN